MFDPRPTACRASGLYLWLEGDEVPYLDLIQGYSTTVFGHCDEELAEQVSRTLKILDHVNGMTSYSREELAHRLAMLTPVENGRVYFDVGGALVVSLAVRLACKITRRNTFLALRHAFHGFSTEGEELSLSFLGTAHHRLPQGIDIRFFDPGSEEMIEQILSCRYAAILVEPLQGANGLRELPSQWLKKVARACRRSETLLISDEIQVGLGRTGTFAAIERYDVQPDVVTYGKALGGGVFPLSALVVSESVYHRIPDWPSSALGSTFSCSPLGCSIGMHVVNRIDNLLKIGRIRFLGSLISRRLTSLIGQAEITTVRAYGLGIALDFGDRSAARRFVNVARDQHVLTYACGARGNTVKLYPPYTITESEAHLICDAIGKIAISVEML
ncbi:MAG: aminotransferase class III-fold pyridoxal phosphate-dependent enzyme [Blastocatellia bacterium]|nr:aminotransferase class III-fold pyridoxal phosphate-dependent enzyme [Blastocatellia bacterium]